MSELVRVRLKGGVETNLAKSLAERTDGVEILDEPAQVAFGRLRPATRKNGRPILPTTTVDAEATKKSPASGGRKKESA